MIITVTMNPAIDKTIKVGKFVYGELNRTEHTERDIGGKGINVSKTIRSLGGESLALGFLAGETGNEVERALAQKGIKADFIHVDGETRTNIKICEENGTLTEINETGPVISQSAVKELKEKIRSYCNNETLLILSGSIPGGVDKNIYGELTELAHEHGATVLVDADGDLFKHAIGAGPDIVKPNRTELESYAGLGENASEGALFDEAKKMQNAGTKFVAISMGGEGALFLSGAEKYYAPALKVTVNSTVGAGDAMVAGLALSWERKLETREWISLSVACSAGACATEGTKPAGSEVVESLQKTVIIKER